ncbi:MAG: family 1 glycosylhydrolase [Anaerolineales bacterium]|nr:family 1 glycosylhydrolase [Anaerolineales bacterium]
MEVLSAHHHFPPSFLWGSTLPGCTELSDRQVENASGRLFSGAIPAENETQTSFWIELLDLVAASGLSSMRIPLDWRILQPEQHSWDKQAVEFYQFLLNEMVNRDIKPVVVMMSGSLPGWFIELGGWIDSSSIQTFAQYAVYAVDSFGSQVDVWITMEDPVHTALIEAGIQSDSMGADKPAILIRVLKNLLGAHREAYESIHSEQSALVSYAQWYWPAFALCPEQVESGINRRMLSKIQEFYRTGSIEYAGEKLQVPGYVQLRDGIALGYANMAELAPSGLIQPCQREELQQWDTTTAKVFEQEGLENLQAAIRWARTLSLPVYIIRHQIFSSDTTVRKRIVFQTLRELWNFVNESWPVRGYFFHSFIDGRDCDTESAPSPGCSAVISKTGEIRHRPLGDLYQQICLEEGISSDLTRTQVPELYSRYFPGKGPRDLDMRMQHGEEIETSDLAD